MNNILLLGGGGFIGSTLAEKLLGKYNIIIFEKDNCCYPNLAHIQNDIKLYKGDFNNNSQLDKLLRDEKIDIIIHLISSILPSSNYKSFLRELDYNFNPTTKLIKAMHKRGINKLIYFSSGGTVYGKNYKTINTESSPTNPINYYGWMKLTNERYLELAKELYGLEYLVLRPANAYGPRQRVNSTQGLIAVTLGRILAHKKIEVWGDGSTIRDYIYIDDICDAVSKLISKDKWNETYNIGTSKGYSVNEVLDIIKQQTKINFKVNYTKDRPVDIHTNILDCTKLDNAISWSNLTNLPNGINKYWCWLKNENK